MSFSVFAKDVDINKKNKNDLDSILLEVGEWRDIGPFRGGRSTTATGITGNDQIYYMGTTGGGLWKTNDAGLSWKNVSDGFFATGSVGAVSVSESNNNIVVVGMGESPVRGVMTSSGDGVYKSVDAGETWEHIGLDGTKHISQVRIHPDNPDVMYVSAQGSPYVDTQDRGVYRTTDGGKNWKKVLFVDASSGAIDLAMDYTNPRILYAAFWDHQRLPWYVRSGGKGSGIWKSVDGGDTWKKLEDGLPKSLMGKIGVTVSRANPKLLYAIIESDEGGLYKSQDGGESWRLVNDERVLRARSWYYMHIYADPSDENVVYVLNAPMMKSIDGGNTFTNIPVPHGDNHYLWINPNNSDIMINSNDGGANISFNAGKSWSTQKNQPTSQFYRVNVDNRFPYWVYGGQQDNYSTVSVPSLPPYGLQAGPNAFITNTGGCETGPAVPKPGNPNIVYSNCKGRFGVFNKATGQEKQYYVGASNMYGHNPKDLKYRFQRVSPIHVSPHNPDVIYHASQYLHVTKDEGVTWETISPDLTAFESDKQVISGSPITRDITGEEFYSTIYSVRESSIEKGLIWVGANDGPVHVTSDGGKNWKNVTPNINIKGGRVDSVEPSTHNSSKAFVTILRYQLGDWKPYIYRTYDKGNSWDLVTKGIPSDHPVRVLREDPKREGLLFAGTEFGMFISFDDGNTWSSFQQNLPVTQIGRAHV